MRQTAAARGLFIEPAARAGWFRYHDLLREFLRASAPFNTVAADRRIVAWFEAHDDLEMAIEQAVASGLSGETARLLARLPTYFVRDGGRSHSLRRWVLSMDADDLATNPDLLLHLGTNLQAAGEVVEGWQHIRRGVALCEAHDDPAMLPRAWVALSIAENADGAFETALDYARQALEDPACDDATRLRAYYISLPALLRLGRFRRARRLFEEAAAMARRLGDETTLRRMQHNLATFVLTPLGDSRWRRHAQAVLTAQRLPHYAKLLTTVDPELGARFWALLLAEDVASGQAAAALQAIGETAPLLALLRHGDPAARARAAEMLASMGREEAMPALAQALAEEQDRSCQVAMEAALVRLESSPPPPLRIKLMGGFELWRGSALAPASAWYRPIVRKLFQYFALHRGKALPREQIFMDLWPDLPPGRAWTAFSTAYSRLHGTLDPHLRRKVSPRYFVVSGESYCFDPTGLAVIDVEQFEHILQTALRVAEIDPTQAHSQRLLGALESWQPLLPELPVEDWLVAPRERLYSLYVDGCASVARAMLTSDNAIEAIVWARRAVDAAPWLEEGYQTLMRAYARQGQRGSALKTYHAAVSALRAELGVEPSALTRWLAQRLQQGEDI